jgi:hypothetical protein
VVSPIDALRSRCGVGRLACRIAATARREAGCSRRATIARWRPPSGPVWPDSAHSSWARRAARRSSLVPGTGVNQEYYPHAVTELVLTEPGEHRADRLMRQSIRPSATVAAVAPVRRNEPARESASLALDSGCPRSAIEMRASAHETPEHTLGHALKLTGAPSHPSIFRRARGEILFCGEVVGGVAAFARYATGSAPRLSGVLGRQSAARAGQFGRAHETCRY